MSYKLQIQYVYRTRNKYVENVKIRLSQSWAPNCYGPPLQRYDELNYVVTQKHSKSLDSPVWRGFPSGRSWWLSFTHQLTNLLHYCTYKNNTNTAPPLTNPYGRAPMKEGHVDCFTFKQILNHTIKHPNIMHKLHTHTHGTLVGAVAVLVTNFASLHLTCVISPHH